MLRSSRDLKSSLVRWDASFSFASQLLGPGFQRLKEAGSVSRRLRLHLVLNWLLAFLRVPIWAVLLGHALSKAGMRRSGEIHDLKYRKQIHTIYYTYVYRVYYFSTIV